MRIHCPSCATAYEIADATIGAKGRKLKCGKCSITWQVEPPRADRVVPEAPSAPAAPAPDPSPAGRPPESRAPEPEPDAGWTAAATEEEVDVPFSSGDDVAAAFAALTEGAPPADPPPARPRRREPAVNLLEGLDAKTLASDGISNIADGDGEPLVLERPRITVKESLASIEANVASALAEANDDDNPNGAAARRGGRRETIRRSFAKDGGGRRAVGIASIAAAVALVIAAMILRHPIVRAAPDLAGLYEKIGLGVNLRGLAFRDIRMLRDQGANGPVFVVEGVIENISSRTVRLPEVLFSLRDDTASELFSWTSRLSLDALPAGEVTRFKTELASAPAIATDVMVRFADRPVRKAGL